MDKIYDLKYKSGPHGDECTTYYIVLYKDNITLQDFINAIIKNNLNEWGTIYVKVKDPELTKLDYLAPSEQYKEIKIEYGQQIKTPRSEYLRYIDKYIDKSYNNWANGGWGYMSFNIKLQD